MDLTNYIITDDTPPALIPMIMAYALDPGPIPSRQELLSRRYELDGHCSLKGLTQQANDL